MHIKSRTEKKNTCTGAGFLNFLCSCAESIAALTTCCVGCNWCLQKANVFTDGYRINCLFGANLYHSTAIESIAYLGLICIMALYDTR